ncbi:MAG: hypothetical protein GY789_11440 [Hyphomicrobiales bacterium]|nr:hypothetical protein [Hyphomicrobiales bacterium]MCP5001139.1 hypothetical protein [Hyphomicrobiales bacterium]
MRLELFEAAAEREIRRHGAGLAFIDETLGNVLLLARREPQVTADGFG